MVIHQLINRCLDEEYRAHRGASHLLGIALANILTPQFQSIVGFNDIVTFVGVPT